MSKGEDTCLYSSLLVNWVLSFVILVAHIKLHCWLIASALLGLLVAQKLPL